MDTQAILDAHSPEVAQRRVWVCRQPATEAALYDLAALGSLRWTQVSGGRREVMAHYFVSAIVQCDAAVEGDVGHAGSHGGPCPHAIRVVVVASNNDKATMTVLRNVLGPQPRRVTNADRAMAFIASAGPDGINQSRLYECLGWSGWVGGRRLESLHRLVSSGQITVESEERTDRLGRMRYQTIYRLADSAYRT